ncbi:hypothetical protein FACS1894110_00790 [Spirochaetia bacterium]|nr:hypothetical protein FACS1894110_00790 [Spirochaetia bacterium]
MAKKRRLILGIFLFILIGIPLVFVGLSFIGRQSPDAVIPDSFSLYAGIPNPVRLAERVLGHETLPDILSIQGIAPAAPALRQLRESGLLENRLVRFAARGRLEGALLSNGRFLGAWDFGVLSPLFKMLPVLAGRLTIPGLYYVQAGKNSRFEYRAADGTVFFVGPYHNLLIISNNSALFESVLNGTSRDGDRRGSNEKTLYSRDYDAALLFAPAFLEEMLGTGEPMVAAFLEQIQFPDSIEVSISIAPKQLNINLITPLASNNQALKKIIERDSAALNLKAMLPDTAQYATILSAGSLQELLSGVSSAAGSDWDAIWKKADSGARMALRLTMEDILYSWTGAEFAVFGMEGRPNPVIVIEIGDEQKRREIFDKAFSSMFVNENIQLNLDGTRIPRIQLPEFLNSILNLMGLRIPSPYYTVQNNYLFVSESAESLLAAINAVRRNETLPKSDVWRTLAGTASDNTSFSLFYSLDRSLPFFLKGNTTVSTALRLYRQGLARLSLENGVGRISLSVIPGSGKGLSPVMGYPFDLGGKAGSRLYSVPIKSASNKGGESRILLTRDAAAVAINPADKSVYELKTAGGTPMLPWVIPAEGLPLGNDGIAWVVSPQGRVTLADKNMEAIKGFPVVTSIRLSAAPGAHGGKLYLCGEDGSITVIDGSGGISKWDQVFDSPLRSPPEFIDWQNKTYLALYPKSFFGELRIHDSAGAALPGWPVYVSGGSFAGSSGIAFGSPLLFNSNTVNSNAARSNTNAGRSGGNRLLAAFITQAGELTVYEETAEPLPGFPVELPGVFYLQPVYDGQYLWLINGEGILYQVDLEGNFLRQQIPNLTVREGGYLTTVDVDGDKIHEIFFSGEGNALYGYSRNFSSLDGFPLPVWGRPVFADLNGDGKLECLGAGMDNKIYQWQFR